MLQRLAFQKLHGDERLAFVLANLVNGADVWVIQRGGGARFSLESLQRLPVFAQRIRQELEGNQAAQFCILSAINHTHPTAPELLENAVVRNRLTDQNGKTLSNVAP